MKTKTLFIATAVIELGAGLSLVLLPVLAVKILIGAPFDTPADTVVGRVAGAALLALGLCCLLARNDNNKSAVTGIVLGMLLYNVGTLVVLACAGIGLRLSGIGLWPAVMLHAAIAIWCFASVLTRSTTSTA